MINLVFFFIVVLFSFIFFITSDYISTQNLKKYMMEERDKAFIHRDKVIATNGYYRKLFFKKEI